MNKTAFLLIGLLTAGPATLTAQQPRDIRGIVVHNGQPKPGVNVFLLETLDGALTDSAGRFAFSTTTATGTTIVIQCHDCREQRFADDGRAEWRIDIQQLVALPAISVAAGRFAAGNAPDAQIDATGVVRTPGAAADVYRALQTFPGLQPVDEGAGLFVRGGDIAETRVFVNDAVVLAPYKHETPTGGFFGAFDPFLLDGIQFSSGGFSAEHGDALSGVANLRTLGRPEHASLGATLSLAAASATASTPLRKDLGVRATFTRSNTGMMFRLNGTDTEFTRVPEGRDASFIGEWSHAPGSSIRLFMLDQWSDVGVVLNEPSFDGALDARSTHRAAVATLEQRIGPARAGLTIADARSKRTLEFGALDIDLGERLEQVRARVEHDATSFLRMTVGAEAQRRTSSFEGRIPRDEHDPAPGAPVDTLTAELDGTRMGAFLQADWGVADVLRVVVGTRADRSDLTEHITLDPRASLALRINSSATLTAAWGFYHQVPDPELFEIALGTQQLGSMRAQHAVLGAQLAAGDALLRIEAYHKTYDGLVQLTRQRGIDVGGTGTSRGIDVFAKWPSWHGFTGRTSYGFLRATRTDPDTHTEQRSPFDITHVVTAIIEHPLPGNLDASVALRAATGKPVTPVTNARFDDTRGIWEPMFGTPNSERLPSFRRVDAAITRLVPLGHGRMLVLFTAVNNLFDRKNTHAYLYNVDYTERTEVRSQFRRSFYFGASVDF
ncbi:MAG TPA: TonB-dependent receptor [Longimicrobiales bacterium]|nr:TonB-dependent receptor [Longimicrobiales bacterium]